MLQRGSTGDPQIEVLQHRLAALGLYSKKFDTDFGPGTEAGLKKFQENSKIPVTGMLDAQTTMLLFPPASEMKFALTPQDETKLQHAHPILVKIVHQAAKISVVPFRIGETSRSVEQQKENIAKGVSWTMNSRHIVGPNGKAMAVDLLAMPDGQHVSWSWAPYYKIADAMKQACRDLGYFKPDGKTPLVEWGGDWTSIKDGPHFQLPWNGYPA